jgi:transposase
VIGLLPRAVRVYVATRPVRLNKSFDGLTHEVRTALELDPLSGHVFVFLNRRRTMVKLLVWTRGGFTIMHKRLERGTFAFAKRVTEGAAHVELDAHELSMLLEGLELHDARPSRGSARWEPPEHLRCAA